MKETYTVKSAQRNALWEYETGEGNSVTTRWGRLGTAYSSLTKNFPSAHKRDEFINKKVREKLKEGYTKVTEEDVKKEENTANVLGVQNKISQMIKINRKTENVLEIGQEPHDGIVVVLLNSWTKEKNYYWIGAEPTQNFSLSGVSVTNDVVRYGSMYPDNMAKRLRELCKQIIQKVKQIVKTMGFANRTLFLGDDSFDSVVDEVKKTGEFSAVDDSVINSLITGKDRVLFLE